MSGSENSLDLSTLNELREMLEDGLDELLAEYLDDVPRQLAKLRDAVAVNDLTAVAAIAHTLKGSSGNLGISRLYQICSALEQEANSGEVADASAMLRVIESEYTQVKLQLAVFMQG